MKFNETITLIVFIVYTVVALLLFQVTPTFIVSYVFTLIAVLAVGYINSRAYDKEERSVFNTFPVISVSGIYLAAQVLISLAFMGLMFSLTISTVVQVIILAIYLILALLLLRSRDHIEDVEKETMKETRFYNRFHKQIEVIDSVCDNVAYKQELDKFKEEVRYINPVSTEESADVEKEIEDLTHRLIDDINNDDANAFSRTLTILKNKVREREMIVKR